MNNLKEKTNKYMRYAEGNRINKKILSNKNTMEFFWHNINDSESKHSKNSEEEKSCKMISTGCC